jgi:pyruvate,orthophosphate dikinase
MDDDVLMLLVTLKGFCPRDAAIEIGGIDAAALDDLLARLTPLLDTSSPRFIKATDAGKDRGAQIIASHRDAIGADAAREILASFHGINDRFKTLVTSWQMRPSDGPPVFNDHSDPAYDAEILGEMPALHADTVAWAGEVDPAGPMPFFLARFSAAFARIEGGETSYLASPKVDSYHNVWFELHEYLIRLVGLTRAEAENG